MADPTRQDNPTSVPVVTMNFGGRFRKGEVQLLGHQVLAALFRDRGTIVLFGQQAAFTPSLPTRDYGFVGDRAAFIVYNRRFFSAASRNVPGGGGVHQYCKYLLLELAAHGEQNTGAAHPDYNYVVSRMRCVESKVELIAVSWFTNEAAVRGRSRRVALLRCLLEFVCELSAIEHLPVIVGGSFHVSLDDAQSAALGLQSGSWPVTCHGYRVDTPRRRMRASSLFVCVGPPLAASIRRSRAVPCEHLDVGGKGRCLQNPEDAFYWDPVGAMMTIAARVLLPTKNTSGSLLVNMQQPSASLKKSGENFVTGIQYLPGNGNFIEVTDDVPDRIAPLFSVSARCDSKRRLLTEEPSIGGPAELKETLCSLLRHHDIVTELVSEADTSLQLDDGVMSCELAEVLSGEYRLVVPSTSGGLYYRHQLSTISEMDERDWSGSMSTTSFSWNDVDDHESGNPPLVDPVDFRDFDDMEKKFLAMDCSENIRSIDGSAALVDQSLDPDGFNVSTSNKGKSDNELSVHSPEITVDDGETAIGEDLPITDCNLAVQDGFDDITSKEERDWKALLSGAESVITELDLQSHRASQYSKEMTAEDGSTTQPHGRQFEKGPEQVLGQCWR